MNFENGFESRLKYPFSLDKQQIPAYLKVAVPEPITAGFTIRPQGFSEGSFASANMGFQVGDQDQKVARNRNALRKSFGKDVFSALVTARQVHGNRCLTVSDFNPEKILEVAQTGADALLTDQPGILLGVLTADCLPLIMIDRKRRAVAVVHAGWRGLERAVATIAIAEMSRRFAVAVENLEIYAGPAIGQCCFQVGIEVVERFQELDVLQGNVGWWQKRTAGYYVDLLEILRIQLLAAGILEDNFHAVDICTCCHDFCFSYRRDHAITGRQLAFVGIKEKII